MSGSSLQLRWDVLPVCGYTLEAATNAVNPFWFRLTDTNFYGGINPSAFTQTVNATGAQLIYRIRALHAPF